MQRREFLKITATAAPLLFLKLPLLSKQNGISPAYYCAKVFDNEKANLSNFVEFEYKFEKNKKEYMNLLKSAVEKYKKEGNSLIMSPSGIADALHFFTKYFYKIKKFQGYRQTDALNKAIQLHQSDSLTSSYFFADFLLSIGMPKEHIKFARILADSKYEAGDNLLKVGNIYFKTTFHQNDIGGISIYSQTEDLIREQYSGPITLYSLDEDFTLLNIGALSSFLSQESRTWLNRLLANKKKYDETGIKLFRGAYEDSLKHFIIINEHATKTLQELILQRPEDARLHYDSGYFIYEKCLWQKELFPEETPNDIYLAAFHFGKAIQIFEDYWPAYLMHAECLLLMGNGEGCKMQMQKALSIMPDGERKKESIGRYWNMLNELEQKK